MRPVASPSQIAVKNCNKSSPQGLLFFFFRQRMNVGATNINREYAERAEELPFITKDTEEAEELGKKLSLLSGLHFDPCSSVLIRGGEHFYLRGA
jgi:hypothetical protein